MNAVLCDTCKIDCSNDYLTLEREMKFPTVGDDIESKQFCGRVCLVQYADEKLP